MNEFELIRLLTRNAPTHPQIRVGPGDDCAVLDLGVPERLFLLKTDAVVEGIHFQPDAPPRKVGHKALARALSDIAAMAGEPVAALITLGLPTGFDPARIQEIYEGIDGLARRHGVGIAGGETTTTPERLMISVSLFGQLPRGQAALRRGAQPGDAIFVTGELGGSLDGHHLDFEPRISESRWLAEHFPVHSMIDLSDGLAGDLRHLLEPEGLGAELLATTFPIRRAAKLRAREGRSPRTPLLAALTDGEDFELLFTQPAGRAVALLDAWREKFPAVKLTCIGRIRKQPGLLIRDHTGVRELKDHGYVHFQEP